MDVDDVVGNIQLITNLMILLLYMIKKVRLYSVRGDPTEARPSGQNWKFRSCLKVVYFLKKAPTSYLPTQ